MVFLSLLFFTSAFAAEAPKVEPVKTAPMVNAICHMGPLVKDPEAVKKLAEAKKKAGCPLPEGVKK